MSEASLTRAEIDALPHGSSVVTYDPASGREVLVILMANQRGQSAWTDGSSFYFPDALVGARLSNPSWMWGAAGMTQSYNPGGWSPPPAPRFLNGPPSPPPPARKLVPGLRAPTAEEARLLPVGSIIVREGTTGSFWAYQKTPDGTWTGDDSSYIDDEFRGDNEESILRIGQGTGGDRPLTGGEVDEIVGMLFARPDVLAALEARAPGLQALAASIRELSARKEGEP